MTGYLDWLKSIRDSDLPATTKLTAYTLATYMDFETGECFPSRSTLAKNIGASVWTVTRATNQLALCGWIEKTRRMDSTNVYRRV